jgi:hypothetical protein
MVKKIVLVSLILSCFLWINNSCSKKDPSTIKIYVRSLNNNTLVSNADVVIISDLQSGTNIPSYVDTLKTNSSGYVTFEIDSFFDLMESNNTTCDFDIIAKKDTLQGIGKLVGISKHTTNVETVYLY